jgi:hypothetical protein
MAKVLLVSDLSWLHRFPGLPILLIPLKHLGDGLLHTGIGPIYAALLVQLKWLVAAPTHISPPLLSNKLLTSKILSHLAIRY